MAELSLPWSFKFRLREEWGIIQGQVHEVLLKVIDIVKIQIIETEINKVTFLFICFFIFLSVVRQSSVKNNKLGFFCTSASETHYFRAVSCSKTSTVHIKSLADFLLDTFLQQCCVFLVPTNCKSGNK